jgi:pyruvate,water dikinase
MLPVFPVAILFADAYKEITGSSDEMAPHVLLQGFPTRTVDAGHALWRLSREARRHPDVAEALAAEKPDDVFSRLAATPEGREFAEALRAYLDEFGWRGDSWIIDDRTWVDYPRTPLATLRGYLAKPDDESPIEEHARLAAERERAVAQVREKLAGASAEARGQFEGLLRAAQLVAEVQEDHNFYIDQMLQHLARRAFVEAGRRMVARGQIDDAEDVLYLTTDELREQASRAGAEDLRARIGERRLSLARWRMVSPPPAIGTPPPPPPADYQPNPVERGMMGFLGGPPKAGTATEIRGNAGSRGKVSGIARVAMTLSEATSLQPGEILVCPTTAPPWTPLFATAAAVVTDTGGILSHCAVVAREFGIPAVVGTGVGTQRIRTGQRVTVDGSAGVVSLE